MSTPLPLHLVFPLSRGQISGGHIYNERLAEGLAAHRALSSLSIDDLVPELTRGRPGCFLLDSLDIDRVEMLPERAFNQRLGLIAHHLPSLDCFGAEAADARAQAQARERALLAHFDFVVATGKFAADYLRHLGVPEERLTMIPPASPARSLAAARPPTPPLRALLVANVIPRKGVLDLLEALLVALGDHHELELSIVGRLDLDPDYAKRCANVVASTTLSRVVRLVGAVPPDHVASFYTQAHVLVSPSRMETFGMALQEARSFGVPILAFDAGNVREHVQGENGRLLGSIPDVATALLELLDDQAELSRLLAAAESCRPSVDYDWPAAARALLLACARCPAAGS